MEDAAGSPGIVRCQGQAAVRYHCFRWGERSLASSCSCRLGAAACLGRSVWSGLLCTRCKRGVCRVNPLLCACRRRSSNHRAWSTKNVNVADARFPSDRPFTTRARATIVTAASTSIRRDYCAGQAHIPTPCRVTIQASTSVWERIDPGWLRVAGLTPPLAGLGPRTEQCGQPSRREAERRAGNAAQRRWKHNNSARPRNPTAGWVWIAPSVLNCHGIMVSQAHQRKQKALPSSQNALAGYSSTRRTRNSFRRSRRRRRKRRDDRCPGS